MNKKIKVSILLTIAALISASAMDVYGREGGPVYEGPHKSVVIINDDPVGISGVSNQYLPTSGLLNFMITSPDQLDDPDLQPLGWHPPSGASFYITGVSIFSSDTGSDLDLFAGASVFGIAKSGNTIPIVSGAAPYTAGVQGYYATFNSGITVIPTGRPLVMDFSDSATPDWVQIELSGVMIYE